MLIRMLVLLLVVNVVVGKLCTKKCYPGDACYPSAQIIDDFRNTLVGGILLPGDAGYDTEKLTWNRWFTQSPAVLVFVQSLEDVQKAMIFARRYNLHVTVSSSGHDFIGRSTFPGSFQINLSRMKGININLSSTRNNAGEVRIESGASWGLVYQTVDKYNRVVVGGSAHTVAQGGYSQGGGHSPISRTHGLAVDQILEMTVVLVDGRIVNCSASGSIIQEVDGTITTNSDTDLFWALRGGGGGTYGVVVTYTYKLHPPPKQMTMAYFSTALSLNGDKTMGRNFFNVYNNFLRTMPKEWGGYAIFSNYKINVPPYGDFVGTVSFLLNHFGEINQANMDALNQFKVLNPYPWTVWNVTTFWEYSQNVTDGPSGNSYFANTFVQANNLEGIADYLLTVLTREESDGYPSYYCTGTHIGGKVSEVDSEATPVHDGFRSGLIALSCSVSMGGDPSKYPTSIIKGQELYVGLKKHGYGTYVNEPSPDMSDWKEQFWGRHYSRLLGIKRKYDPDNFLYCPHCVGSDLE